MSPPRPALGQRLLEESPRRPVPAPQRPRLEVVRGRSVPGRRPPFLFVFIVAVTCAALFTLVVVNVVVGQAAFTQAELEQGLSGKRTAVGMLDLEVQRLRSPKRIAAEAERLGLVPAEDVSVLVAPSGGRGRP